MENQLRDQSRRSGAKAAAAVALLFLAAGAVRAETDQERGKRVVTEAIAALGGERFLAMKDRLETGRVYSFYRDQLSGLSTAKIYTKYLDEPDDSKGLRVVERQAFGKEEDILVLFTRDAGYEITYRGARPLPADRMARYRESTPLNVFYIFRHRLKEPGLIFESRGTEVWQNQPVEIVDIIDAQNRTVTVYFHRTTKLPVRQLYFRRDPETKDRIEEVTLFSKYRDVGGIQWPLNQLRERDKEKVFEIFAESVTFNQGLTDDLFVLPTGMQVLKPAR